MSESSREMPPGIRPGALPPFHLIDEYAFQELCRDLLDLQPGVAYCEVYGRRGQPQRGIDLLAPRQHNDGVEVGQCKRYAELLPSHIVAASDEFFNHWAYWQSQQVRRFVLFVAADLTERSRQDEIAAQRARFAEHGIEYEVWSASTLRNRLRPHPGIVATYCTPADYWLKVICGSTRTQGSVSEGQGGINTVVSAAMVGLVERLTGRLSDELQRRLDLLREAWREGRRPEAEEGIREIRADAGVWDALGTEVRAKVIRLQAALELDLPAGLDRARRLSEEARVLENGASQRRLDALIARVEAGPEAALALLGAPGEADDRHLAAAFLLEAGRLEEARTLLDFAETGFAPTAETFRLQALASVAAHDLDAARLASQKALELAPRWDSVRFVAAAVECMSALSPAAWPDAVTEWPVPVEWVYVRRDEASLARLRGAAVVFATLAAGDARPRDDRRGYETWHLACLANDPDRQEEAVARCRELLASDATHPGAFAWAVARRFDVDFDVVEQALLALLESDADLQPVLSLASYYLASGQIDRAEALLHETRSRFEDQEQIGLWTFWYAQVRIGQRDPAGALAAIREVPATPGLRRLRSLALRAQAELTGEWEEVVRELDREYQETADAALLFETCSALAGAEQWEAIADRAERLAEVISTGDVVRLAARAAYTAQRLDLCLRLLDGHRDLFRNGKLPHDLRGVRIRVLHRLGGISEALAEAEALAREEPTLDNVLALAQLLYSKGDLVALAAVARTLLGHENLSAYTALQLARGVIAEVPELAERLWQHAVDKGLADSEVRDAVDLGHRLGLDARMDALMERFFELGRQGREGIFMGRLEDLLEIRAQHYDNSTRLNDAYRTGAGPIHLIARALNASLVDLYHRRLRNNAAAPDPAHQFALFARHGVRASAIPLPEEHGRRRLHLDITALLLAHHAEILGLVEEEFAPLRVPSEVIPALIRIREKLLPHQATQLTACREVVELHAAGAIRVVPNEPPALPGSLPAEDQIGTERLLLLSWAQSEGGYVLDHFPIRSGLTAPVELPTEVQIRFTSSRAVAESLWRYGPLSEPEYLDALGLLHTEPGSLVQEPVPRPGDALYCHGNTAEFLADLALLRAACERFHVYMTTGTLERARATVAEHEQRGGDADWVARLLDRLSQGIDAGTYQVIAPIDETDQEDDDDEPDADDLYGLRTLLLFEAEPGDVVWVDDRFGSGYWSRGGVPVFGIAEVLQMLVERERLEQADLYRVLAQLRAANVRFLAPTADEVLHHLSLSRVEAGRVVETRELAVLRRYLAACLLDGERLEPPLLPNGTPNPKTEVAFLAALDRTSVSALVDVWTDPHVDDVIRRARSEWVLESLFVDFAAMRRLVKLTTSEDDERALVAVSLASMVIYAFGADWPSEDKSSLRDRYLAWLDSRVLQRRFDAEPLLAPTVAQIIRDTLLTIRELDSLENVPKIIRIGALQLMYDALPERIQEELGKDDALLTRLEMEAVPTSAIGERHFRRDEFRNAVAAVVNGRVARIRSVDQDKEFVFHPSEPGEGIGQFRVETTDGSPGFTLRDDILPVLSESPSEREACLRANRHWYDCPSAGFEAWVAKLASTEDPLVRMELAETWRDESATVFYVQLHEQLRRGQPFRWAELLPPSGNRLLGHFRLQPDIGTGATFRDALANAAAELLREDDLDAAVERWSGLPVALPTRITEEVKALSPAERRAFVKKLLRTATSPVGDVHFLRLLWFLGDDEPVYRRLAERRAVHLFTDEYRARLGAFEGILEWAGEAFTGWADAQSWAAPTRLAAEWLHAHRLFAGFVAAGVRMVQVEQIFRGKPSRIAHRFIWIDTAYDVDIAHPRRFEPLPFLVFGLAYACGEDRVRELGTPLRGVVRGAALRQPHEDVQVAELPLLRDVEQAGNALESWLGGISREVATAFLEAQGEWLTSDARATVALGALDQLMLSASNHSAWAFLRSVVEDLPPRPQLRERLVRLVLGSDYVAMVREDPSAAAGSIRTLAAQARHFADTPAAAHLRSALTTVAGALAHEFRDRSSADLLRGGDLMNAAGALLEAAVDLSRAGGLDDDSVALFAVLLEELLAAWPALASMIFVLVHRLQMDLPVHRALYFAHLAVRLRAEPAPLR